MGHTTCAGNRKDDGAALEQPRQRDLTRRCAFLLRQAIDQTAWLGEFTGGEREPGDEADAVGLAIVEHVLVSAVGEVVAVLDRRDREDLPGRFDLFYRHLAQASVSDQALIDEGPDRA